jgi:phosphatidate cytidylyltransferase
MTTAPKSEERPEEPAQSKRPALSNLVLRLLTALMVIPVALFAMVTGGVFMLLVLAPFALLGVVEFYVLLRHPEMRGVALTGAPAVLLVLLAFYLAEPLLALGIVLLCAALTLLLQLIRNRGGLAVSLWQMSTTLSGVFYIGFPLAFLIVLQGLPDGLLWLLLVFICTWGTDTCAYAVGRLWGKRKLAPRISPKKTIEGAIAGVIGGFLLTLGLLAIGDKVTPASVVMIAFAPLVAIVGDLLESALKRIFQVKDSHLPGLNVLPGHGGVLDRVDSLLMVTVYIYVFITLAGLAT